MPKSSVLQLKRMLLLAQHWHISHFSQLATVWASVPWFPGQYIPNCQKLRRNLLYKTLYISSVTTTHHLLLPRTCRKQQQAVQSWPDSTQWFDPTCWARCPSPPKAIFWTPNWEDCGLMAQNEPIRMSSSPQEWNCMLAVELVKA